MQSRRLILTAGVAVPLGLSVPSLAQTAPGDIEAEIHAWIEGNKARGFFDPAVLPEPQRGSLILAPDHPAVRRAAELLAKVPTNVLPLLAAKWMMDVMDPSDTMEWPADTPDTRRPANPIVIALFAKTRTSPVKGDQTAWCAAFMNWILDHTGFRGTGSAGAVSFRDLGSRTRDPSPGDLACFVNTSDPRFGHICFFDGWVAGREAQRDRFWAVGGNQKNRLGRDPFGVQQGKLRLHSFRTALAPK